MAFLSLLIIIGFPRQKSVTSTVVILGCADEMLRCDHSHETSLALLSLGTIQLILFKKWKYQFFTEGNLGLASKT